jgi:hypothetical protein
MIVLAIGGYLLVLAAALFFVGCLCRAAAMPAPHPPSPGADKPTARPVVASLTQARAGHSSASRARLTQVDRRPGMSGPEAS